MVYSKPTAEQVTSLRLGLAQLSNTDAAGVLVWPVDHPFARAESALAVVDAARRTGAPIVVHGYGARVLEVPVGDPGIRRDIDTRGDLGS